MAVTEAIQAASDSTTFDEMKELMLFSQPHQSPCHVLS